MHTNADQNYMELKCKTIEIVQKPKRQARTLDKNVQTYKLRSYHEHHLSAMSKKEKMGPIHLKLKRKLLRMEPPVQLLQDTEPKDEGG